MDDIISYFVDKHPVEIADQNYPEATTVARFIYHFSDSENIFTFQYNNQSPHHQLISKLKLFNPITLSFQPNQPIDQEFLLSITRTESRHHFKNPFTLVTFTPYSDTSRHWVSPSNIDNAPKITVFDNPKTLPLPQPDQLYSKNYPIQFTCISDPHHRSFGFPRIRAIKRGDSILIPSPQIINGLTTETLRSLKNDHNIRLFIGCDDEETHDLAPNITPQECDDSDINRDATTAQTLEYALLKLNTIISTPGLPSNQSTTRTHLDRLSALTAGQGAVLIHADRCPQFPRTRAVALARAFASRSPPIAAIVLTSIHMCADTPDLAEDLNPLLVPYIYAQRICFYLTPVPTTIYDTISRTFVPLGTPIRLAAIYITPSNRNRSMALIPREISISSPRAPPLIFFFTNRQTTNLFLLVFWGSPLIPTNPSDIPTPLLSAFNSLTSLLKLFTPMALACTLYSKSGPPLPDHNQRSLANFAANLVRWASYTCTYAPLSSHVLKTTCSVLCGSELSAVG